MFEYSCTLKKDIFWGATIQREEKRRQRHFCGLERESPSASGVY